MFVTACSMDEYAEEKRTEKNLIVCSGISEAETTNNKRLRLTFCIEAIQTRSIVQPLCDSRASCIANLRCNTQCHDVTTMQYKSILHGCIARMYSYAYDTFTAEAENSPLCDRQHRIRQANHQFAGCIILIIEVNTRCATSDVNPFKIHCNLQITNATVNETQ